MAEITKVFKEHIPAVRFIGKIYTNADRQDGGYGAKWGEWFQNGWFDELEKLGVQEEIENGYLGLMGCGDEWENSFIYAIGMFFPPETNVPDGYEFIDLPESDLGTCYIYGKEQGDNIYGMHDDCMKKLSEAGMGVLREDIMNSSNRKWCFFERYNCPRFTNPDENGKIILDYCTYLK